MAVGSFEELGLGPELVEALAAEGMERPTEFQEQALPVIRRGNNLVGRAGPGGGTLVTYAAGLLDRLTVIDDQEEGDESSAAGPRVLVLVATPDAGHRLAGSAVRLAGAVGLRAASIGGTWVLPERAELLFGTAADALDWVREGRLSLEGVDALVVDQLTAVASLSGPETLETLFDFIPRDAQRIVLDLPSGPGAAERAEALADLVERHVRRSVHVPPRAVEGDAAEVPRRGELHFRIVNEPAEEGGLRLVSELLAGGDARHLVIFFRSEDRAADVGDRLTLHGFVAGAPGDTSAPVWLAVDELEAREVLDGPAVADEEVAVLSWDVPADMDALDRRHGAGRGGYVLLLPREVAHFRDVARRTGYRVVPAPPPAEDRVPDDLVETVDALERALEGEDVGVYMLLLETLFERHDPAEVAAAAVALLRKSGLPSKAAAAAAEPSRPGTAGKAPASPSRAPTGTPAAGRGTPWIRLFVSIGSRDDAGPGDIVGAITGETGIDGSKVGRIDIRDSFSIVEVEEPVAERVIQELNGVTVKGRSVRVDYDRPGRGGGTRGRSGPPGGRGPGGPGRDRSPGRGRPGGGRKDGGRSGGSRGGSRDRGS